jgi:PAS domain-containing protein
MNESRAASARPLAADRIAGATADLRRAYDAETGEILRRRLGYHPERAQPVRLVYLAEAAACLGAILACRGLCGRVSPGTIGAALAAVLSGLMTWYMVLVGGAIERIATAQVCLLSGVFVLLPWGWRPQLTLGAAALASLAGGGWHLAGGEAFSYAVLALVAGTTTSTFGAFFLDRYRYDAFVRITERRRAEETLRESERRLRLAMEAAALGTWKLDLASGAVVWDARTEQLFGLAPGSFGGTFEAFLGHVHPDEHATLREVLRRAVEEGANHEAELCAVWPDGSLRWLAYRRRHPARGSAGDLRDLPAGRRLGLAPVRRHGPRSLHRAALRPAARWHGRARQRAGPGLRLHGLPAALGGDPPVSRAV